ncbi:MAG: hypothetical protein JWQ87_2958 [Candidatus Sulfotelmatobacter sp.]|nr:hypothetical protein [Candidatus Sulfotelmatobacter sp.]
MTEKPKETSDARHDLLDSINDQHETIPTFEACLNAHGMYETMRFVLRLSPRNHELMETIEAGGFESGAISSETIQAYSTYIHETIHWWQHVGSTSGLLFSLSYLAQSHSSMEQLREVLTTFGPKKPLKGWTDNVLLKEGVSAQAKLASANIAVNNALDVDYYKSYAYDPRASIKWMIDQNHFESVGHTYFIVYGQLVGLIGDVIDPELSALPKITDWDAEIQRLNSEQVEGYYWRSPVRLPAVGMRAIYEGQARFVQLQFLDGAQGHSLPCTEWRHMGYLSGIYVEAFDAFLKLSGSEWPEQISDPIVGLFLLVCDLAINPTRGLQLDIDSFEDFILDVDVGIRFTRLSMAVKELSHLKAAVKDFSREEYIAISNDLIRETGYDHPLSGLQAVVQWGGTAPGLAKLMEEHRTFEFDRTNLPIRVFVSHFVAFCIDKFETPEFFCWPGKYMSGGGDEKDVREVWLRHLSLFSDRGDKNGVYPRKWPNRSEAAVMQTFNRFYGTITLYDLTRQWILKDGPFVYDYRWISENYSQEHADAWANDTFKQTYGVTLDEFEIVQ